MLYQNADDEILEKDIVIDFNEAELVGSTDRVTIVAQLDRFDGAYDGDGDWTSTRRYLVTRDGDLSTIGSEQLDELGEVDSGDWQSLAAFATWAIETYPARKYALILSDHGAGWVGGWNDNEPREGSSFTTNDIDRALRAALLQTGIGRLDLVGFDACLMSQLESLAAVAPYAEVAVASEEVEPALGWAYGRFLAELAADPAMSAGDLGRSIVASFIVGDGRITDDAERAVLVAEYFGDGVVMSADQMAADLGSDITLTAASLDAIVPLNHALNELALALRDSDQAAVAQARAYAQSFETVFDESQPSPYLDLGHFVSLLGEVLPDDAAVTEAAANVHAAIGDMVVAEKHGPSRPGATGFSFFFPNSALFDATASGDGQPAYTASASRFAVASLWDDFLRFHYTGEPFGPGDADPQVLDPVGGAAADPDDLQAPGPVRATVLAPGAGEEIAIAPIEASAEAIGVDGAVTLVTEVSGANVAYVYLYVAYEDPSSGSYLTADMDFISADRTVEVNGILYPDWGGGVGALEVEWTPTVFFMTDGEQEEFAFFEPRTYGATPEEDTYTVRGIITFADTGNRRPAIMAFTGDGRMRNVFAYANHDGTGALREITLSVGDAFMILEEWLDFDEDPAGVLNDYEGGTLTFTGRPFEMVPVEAYAGAYTLGIVVEDMDGNRQAQYVNVTVE